ncbi:apiosidase-like domain-containing protein [Paenibacillus sp. BAC0078]
MQVSLSENRRSFVVNDKPFFYLADTVWSAFTNASIQEWAEYLEYRKMQGFNVLQINILRQWDASESDIAIEPFGLDPNGYYDYHKLNEEYFDRADEMLGMAVEQGFVPALVLLWCNYVPETWASMFQKDNKMPLDCVEPYVNYVVKRFSKHKPIFLVSGDTDFPNEAANAYYMKALETACAVSPSSLKTLHIQGRLREIPEKLEQHEGIDFYMYQSGHNSQYQSTAYEIARHFYKKSWIRPVINGEPCYEQISYSRNVYGRYSRFDVRKAAWQSLLTGGGAGITYGAHGIWSWHKKGKKFGIVEGEGFDQPYDWRDALRFEGAWDYSFIKYLFENYNLTGLQPAEILLNPSPEIRAAASGDTIVIYVPVNTKLRLNLDLQKYSFTTIDLENRRFAATEMSASGNQTTIHMHRFESDVVLIGEKN